MPLRSSSRYRSNKRRSLVEEVTSAPKDAAAHDFLKVHDVADYEHGKRSIKRGLIELGLFAVFLILFTVASNRYCFNTNVRELAPTLSAEQFLRSLFNFRSFSDLLDGKRPSHAAPRYRV